MVKRVMLIILFSFLLVSLSSFILADDNNNSSCIEKDSSCCIGDICRTDMIDCVDMKSPKFEGCDNNCAPKWECEDDDDNEDNETDCSGVKCPGAYFNENKNRCDCPMYGNMTKEDDNSNYCNSDSDCKLIYSSCNCKAVSINDSRNSLEKSNEICKWNICRGTNVTAVCKENICSKNKQTNKNGNMTKEEFKDIIKEKIEDRREYKFEDKTGQNCTEGCKCTGVVMKCELEDGTREMTVYAQSGNVIIQTKGVNASTTVTLYHFNKTVYEETKNGTVREIKIFPDELNEKLQEKLKVKMEKMNITLNEDGYYEIQANKKSRLFFLFPIREKIRATIDAENGNVKIKNPWWGFLAKDVKENSE